MEPPLTQVTSRQSSKTPVPNPRYLVPDLTPEARQDLKRLKPRYIFVAESPHVNEVEPDEMDERRPLCGAAGRQWWGLLSQLKEGETNSDVSLDRLIEVCKKYQIVVLNAVQYPLDPKVAVKFPKADPVKNLGFNKVSGPFSYKKLKGAPVVQNALSSLIERLDHPSLKKVPIFCLGNDALWFVTQALLPSSGVSRIQDKIPHPSAWWRSGGLYGRVAKEKLMKAFGIQN